MLNKIEFKKMMIEKGYNYDRLAKELHISKPTLVRYVNNGFRTITIEKYQIMQNIFGSELLSKAIFFNSQVAK